MYEQYAYLGALIVSILCLIVIDRRFGLALYYDKIRTLRTIGLSVAVFVAWDIAGILLQIFRVGSSDYLTGIRLLPEFPLEELFFLTLLTYSALLTYRGGERLWQRT